MKIHKHKKSWEEAKKACEKENAELIKPDIAPINKWIREQFKPKNVAPKLYIGANVRVKLSE